MRERERDVRLKRRDEIHNRWKCSEAACTQSNRVTWSNQKGHGVFCLKTIHMGLAAWPQFCSWLKPHLSLSWALSYICNWLYIVQLQKTLCLAIREVIFLVKGLLCSPIMKGYVIHIHKLPPILINSFQKAHIHHRTVVLMLLHGTTMFLSFSSCHKYIIHIHISPRVTWWERYCTLMIYLSPLYIHILYMNVIQCVLCIERLTENREAFDTISVKILSSSNPIWLTNWL